MSGLKLGHSVSWVWTIPVLLRVVVWQEEKGIDLVDVLRDDIQVAGVKEVERDRDS